MKTVRRMRGSWLHRSTSGDLEQGLCIEPCFDSTRANRQPGAQRAAEVAARQLARRRPFAR